MAWTKGWNFRNTSGFVTDTGNNTYIIAEDYPVTRNGVTFGYTQIVASFLAQRDRNAAVDEKFAGLHFSNGTATPETFQIDLPAAADYVIRLSLGDFTYAQTSKAIVKDNTTTLSTITGTTSGANQYLDATGVNRTSPSDWISNNASITKTFASTTFVLHLGLSPADNCFVTHLDLDQVTAVSNIGGLRSFQSLWFGPDALAAVAAQAGVTYPQLERGRRGVSRGVGIGAYSG